MPVDALTSSTISHAYSKFAGQSKLSRSEIRSCIEYRMPTNNIIVLNSYFNLTNISPLVDRL